MSKKKALENISSINMFSKKGWEQVKRCCGHIRSDASDSELADGFISFEIIWYDDNGLVYDNFNDQKREYVSKVLLERYADYIQRD